MGLVSEQAFGRAGHGGHFGHWIDVHEVRRDRTFRTGRTPPYRGVQMSDVRPDQTFEQSDGPKSHHLTNDLNCGMVGRSRYLVLTHALRIFHRSR